MPEHDAITAALARIGFDGRLDTADAVFGTNGILAQTYQKDPLCNDIYDDWYASIPYPPLHDGDIDPIDLIDPELTFEQMYDELRPLEDEFENIAAALRTAAQGLSDEQRVVNSADCG